MKRLLACGLIVLALSVALAAAPSRPALATHPASPQPLLYCGSVNGDAPVTVGDIQIIVSKFGTFDANARANGTYHPLYDLSSPPGTGSGGVIGINDVMLAVLDFGTSCPATDVQIAQATLDVIDPNFHPPAGMPDFPGDPGLLNENTALLASKGYFLASTDVPGQGKHYVNDLFFNDDLFYPTTPEGLVYKNGKLAAQLYYVDGYAVGWGCWPGPEPNCGDDPPEDHVDIDPFCTPTPGQTSCSWAGPYDGWHLHFNLCTVAIGSPQAAAIPGIGSASSCESLHNDWCGGSKCAGTTWRWNDRVGWMGHLWNHWLNPNVNDADVLGNGRFADCIPDVQHWNGFNCPQ